MVRDTRDRGPWWIDAIALILMATFLGLIGMYLGGCSGMGVKFETYGIDSRTETTITRDSNPTWFHCLVNNCLEEGNNHGK